MTTLFEALFALLAEEGPSVRPQQVNAILADPECMAERVAQMRQQLDEERHIFLLSSLDAQEPVGDDSEAEDEAVIGLPAGADADTPVD